MQSAALYHNLHCNNRLQLADIRLGDSSTDEWNWSCGALISYYGTAARDAWNPFANSTDNNGNVLRQLHYVPLSGSGYVLPQLDDYTYDELNRIKSVTEAQLNSGGGWTFNLFTQYFNYDRWGNRTVSCSPCQPGVTGDVFTVDTATNRITAKNGVGMTYDLAGNQTYDATGNRWFDGENRMHKAVQGGTTSHYVYDADGKRVRRIIGSTETWMIYGVDGELVAEYAAAASSSNPQKEYGYRSGQMLIVAQTSPLEIRWTVTDHLGTPRMNIRGTGTDGGSLASVTRHDYLPFGEDLIAGIRVNGGSGQHGYEPPPDGVRQKFTGYERDNETWLDFAEARYYANVQGRFTSPDPVGGHLSDPQTLGKYTYVRNSPLRFSDPTGLDFYLECKGNSDTCQNGRVGVTTVDASGKKQFTATLISNDKNGNLVDQYGNQYTGNFDEKGFHFNNAQGDSFSGSFAEKTAATTLSGAGIFDGFTGVFNSNGLNTNVAQGTLFGTQAQFNQLLGKLKGPNPGLDKLNFFHLGTDQYRGGNKNGDDPHLSYNPNISPDPNDPTKNPIIGQGLHYDGAYPYGSPKGFAEHTYSAVKFLFQTKILGRKEIPPPRTIPR